MRRQATDTNLPWGGYDLDQSLLSVLTEYEEHRLKENIKQGRTLVRIHAGSGRRVLYIGSHATRVLGMSLPEGRVLLSDLLEHATQRQFVYRHEWKPGDLVMWDNRAVLHRGRRYDLAQRRDMRRSTVEDALPSGVS